MSDPRLTGADELAKTVKAVLEEGELSQRTHGIGRGFAQHVALTIGNLAADIERLTAENAALREECEQWREKAARDVGHLIDARIERDARDTLLAEARAETKAKE
jgi:hypothetical protein